MSEVWLSNGQICELTAWTERHVRRAASKIGIMTRISESRGANGRREREYLLSSLPAAAQLKYAQGLAGKSSGSAIILAPAATLPLFASDLQSAIPETARLAVPEELRGQTEQRYTAIQSLLDFRRRTNGHRPSFILADGRAISTLGDLAAYIASQQIPAISSRTIRRWLDRFDAGGYSALADRPRKDHGISRFFAEHAGAATFLQKKFLEEGLSRQMSWEALAREWRAIEKKGQPPSYGTARNYLNALPEPLKVLAREGKRAHESKCSPFVQRTPPAVMACWVSDHRVFDVLVRNSLFPELAEDLAYRLWLTKVCDWGSRKIVGFCFAPIPNWKTINSALRMAVLGHGMPRGFYWDNGEDYKKVRRDLEEITLAEETRALLARGQVEINVTSALPYHARSKPIESWFARWSKRFDVLWQPAYLGNKPGNCPEKTRLAQKQHGQFLKGKRAESPLPLDAEFITATVQWIEEYNATRLESLDHHTPNEVMEEQYPEQSRPKIDPRLLDLLFSERVKRTVLAGGCVELDRMRYEPVDSSLFAMDVWKSRQVMILRDPYNLGEAVAADPETLQFIGELRIQQFVAQYLDGEMPGETKDALKRGPALRRAYAGYLAALRAISSSQGWKTEREELLGRANARTGTDNRPALPPAGVPGARRIAEHSEPVKLSSPFVSDAVEEYLAWEREQK